MTTVLQTSSGGAGMLRALRSSTDLARSPEFRVLHDIKDAILRSLGQSQTWGDLVEEVTATPVAAPHHPVAAMLRRVEFDVSADRGGRPVRFRTAPDDHDDNSW
jgi:hypothetical protein